MRRGRGDFFFSLSLTDFVLTLLFLILLLSIWSLRERASQLAGVRANLEECESRAGACDAADLPGLLDRLAELEEQVADIRALMEKAGYDPEEIERLILVALKDAQKLKELERALVTSESEKTERQTRIDTLQRQVAELERALAAATPRDAQGNLIDVASFSERIGEAESQLAGCRRRMEQCGLGKPPCWADREGKVEYLYTVTIHEASVSATPRWPEHRAREVEGITGAAALPGVELSCGEFGRRARPILEWSRARECRHFVYVIDEKHTTKLAFKRQLRCVEGYFYTAGALDPG